ncbi:MAG: alpha/beta hydrolase, partial [Chromatiaceae bacterium]|nr:alpha/beta hydrolase [Chromatiaceae bacterium]
WEAVMPPLAELGDVSVVAIDRPSCGQTSHPLHGEPGGDGYGAEAQGELVAELIAQLGFSRALLIGNSTGGTVALLAALRHPEKVQGLVLVDAMIYSAYATSEVPAPVRRLMRALTPLFAPLMGFMVARLYNKAMRSFWLHPERLADEQLAILRADFMQGPWQRAFWELFLATRHLHLDARLASCQAPALVISGAHDNTVKTDESERLARELPNAELALIADAAHLPHEEDPAAFMAALAPFVRARLNA